MHMFTLDNLFLLLTGLLAAYLCWYFWQRYGLHKALHNIYYLMGFAVLLVSGLLLIFLGLGILASPYVLTVASLIPLGISMGLAEEYFPSWKTYFKWFAAIGFLAIAITSIGGMDTLKKIAVPLFHGVAGLVIFLGPFFAKGAPKVSGGRHRRRFDRTRRHRAGLHFHGCAVAVLQPHVRDDDPHPLLLLMTGAFALGFTRKG